MDFTYLINKLLVFTLLVTVYCLHCLKATIPEKAKYFTQLNFIQGLIISWRKRMIWTFGIWLRRFHNMQFLRRIMTFIQSKIKFWIVEFDHIVNQLSTTKKTSYFSVQNPFKEPKFSAGKNILNLSATTEVTTGSLYWKFLSKSTTVIWKVTVKFPIKKMYVKPCSKVTWKTYSEPVFKRSFLKWDRANRESREAISNLSKLR